MPRRQASRLGLNSVLSLPSSVSGANTSRAAASVLGAANSSGHITLDTSLSYVDGKNRPLSLKTVGYVSSLEDEVDRKRKQSKFSKPGKPKATKPSNHVPKPCPRFANGGKCHFGASCWDTH